MGAEPPTVVGGAVVTLRLIRHEPGYHRNQSEKGEAGAAFHGYP